MAFSQCRTFSPLKRFQGRKKVPAVMAWCLSILKNLVSLPKITTDFFVLLLILGTQILSTISSFYYYREAQLSFPSGAHSSMMSDDAIWPFLYGQAQGNIELHNFTCVWIYCNFFLASCCVQFRRISLSTHLFTALLCSGMSYRHFKI